MEVISLVQRLAALDQGIFFEIASPGHFRITSPLAVCSLGDRVTLRQKWLDSLFSGIKTHPSLMIRSKEALKCFFCCTQQPSSSRGPSQGIPSLLPCWPQGSVLLFSAWFLSSTHEASTVWFRGESISFRRKARFQLPWFRDRLL
jgi:hypothetical protein